MTPDDRDSSSGDGAAVVLEHEFDENTPASLAIVRAISILENVDPLDCPTDLGFTLFDHVDPEALDAIATGRDDRESVRVTFTCGEYRIQVTDTGQIRVMESNSRAETDSHS